MATFGRAKIYTDVDKITEDNVISVLVEAIITHNANRTIIQHLFDYYKGNQPILQRIKAIRPEIANNTVVNHASEIVAFKVSYLLSSPIMYINRSGDTQNSEKINLLNDFMFLEDKSAKDKKLADSFTICGVGYRFIEPNRGYKDGDAPFVMHHLNPLNTFMIRQNSVGEPAIAGVNYIIKKDNSCIYSVFTKDAYFKVTIPAYSTDGQVEVGVNLLADIPIIEYVNNDFQIGAFEQVETLLDAINVLESNRIDATVQTVQSITVFENCDIDSAQYDDLIYKGAIKIKSVDGNKSRVYVVSPLLNQADQQVLVNSIYKQILTITGMPSIGDGGTSDSSNNGAIIVKSGWSQAESRAKDTELLWRSSERQMLRIVLDLCKKKASLDLPVSAVIEKFTRRNYEDIMTKATVLTTLLNNEKVNPHFAYEASGIAVDPETAYAEAMAWYEQIKKEQADEILRQEKVAKELATQTNKDNSNGEVV